MDPLSRELESRNVKTVWDLFEIPEADDKINNASRETIQEIHREHGQAFLYVLNGKGTDEIVRRYDPKVPVYNFSCSIVASTHDDELVRLIQFYREGGWPPLGADFKAIYVRAKEINASALIWT